MKGRTYLTLVNGEWVVDQPINKYKAGYGKIYKLTNSDGLMYIGSTVNTLEDRFFKHRDDNYAYIKGKKGVTTSVNLFQKGHQDVNCKLIEKYTCEDEKALHARERYWIEFYKKKLGDKVVNKVIPTRTRKEYRKDNKEKLTHQHRCICGSIYALPSKSNHMKTAKHRRFDSTLNYLKEHDPEFYNLIVKDHQTDQIFNDSCKY